MPFSLQPLPYTIEAIGWAGLKASDCPLESYEALAWPMSWSNLPTFNIWSIRPIPFSGLESTPAQLAPEKPKSTHAETLTHFAWLLRRVTFTFPRTRFKYKLEDRKQKQTQVIPFISTLQDDLDWSRWDQCLCRVLIKANWKNTQ